MYIFAFNSQQLFPFNRIERLHTYSDYITYNYEVFKLSYRKSNFYIAFIIEY